VTPPDGRQRLLNAAIWDSFGVRDDVRAHAVERLGDRDGVLGGRRPDFEEGHQVRWCAAPVFGSTGWIENCQLSVFSLAPRAKDAS
jgi:hypothetical protein